MKLSLLRRPLPLLALALGACTTAAVQPVATVPAPAPASVVSTSALEPAPLSELVQDIAIPYDKFTLENGLTVLVNEDHSAPMVTVSVWYDVGSKHEPDGKTGFAHLFEHIMGYGTENIPQGENALLDAAGTVGDNASTWFDRTNYFLTVPTGALDLAMFAKSDQMGYLLGGVTEETLKNQIGVVQNEKRNGLNRPGGGLEFELLERLFPAGHPYRHDTIGSMADLDAASLEVVQDWFRSHYGPNNAVLVLAGDIDPATARAKATQWFGAIPPGPRAPDVIATVPTLAASESFTQETGIPTPIALRSWAVPGEGERDSLALMLAGQVLGGLASSRLDNELVRGQEIAVSVSAGSQAFTDVGMFQMSATAAPDSDIDAVAAAMDAVLAKFLAEGPTEDELQRAKVSTVAGITRSLDSIGGGGGRVGTLAEGQLYFGDPEKYRRDLATFASLTTGEVRDTARRWLSRPVVATTLLPGTPDFSEDPGAEAGGVSPENLMPRPMQPGLRAVTPANAPDRSTPPGIADVAPLDFPEIRRATLSNGMKLELIEQHDVPIVSTRISFDAGFAADPRDELGLQSLMIALMDEGTRNYDPLQFAIAQERLGAGIGGSVDWDDTSFSLEALSANLAPSLALLAEYIREPAMNPTDLERVRAQQVNRIRAEIEEPNELIKRVMYPTLYGPGHPYGIPPSGLGNVAAVSALQVDDLRAFHANWLRPDVATIYMVGDTTLDEAVRMLEQSFGEWRAPATARPAKNLAADVPAPQSRIVLVDTPGAPQAVIRAARVIDQDGTEDLEAITLANNAFGSGSLSRAFQEIRQKRGWSYSPGSFYTQTKGRPLFVLHAPVQTDRTGETVSLMRQLIGDFTTTAPITQEETTRIVEAARRSLPALLTSNGNLLATLVELDKFDRPDDYYETLGARYAAFTPAELAAASAREMVTGDLIYFIVGDRAAIDPQIAGLGLPIEYLDAGDL